MKRKRFSEEQIISILKEQDAGSFVKDIVRRHGVSEQTFYRWKSKFGGMEIAYSGTSARVFQNYPPGDSGLSAHL